MRSRFACAVIVLALLHGCASTGTAPTGTSTTPTTTPAPTGTPVGPERAQRTTRSLNLAGFPPEYQRAYRDGCAAAGTTAKPPAGEALVVQGWRDGFAYCTKRPPQ